MVISVDTVTKIHRIFQSSVEDTKSFTRFTVWRVRSQYELLTLNPSKGSKESTYSHI